jgi:hypothetical protein
MAEAPRVAWQDALAIAVLHGGACVAARALGFDHVSDDDFARVTIAQAFAHAPKLDPSGTSWLPFPFWITGGAMLVVGRSLAAARAIAIATASLAAAGPYLALRFVGVPRGRSLVATALAFGTPWAIWLGAATVPESMTASLTAAAVIGLAARPNRAFAVAMAAACLSRYETWPAAAVMAIGLALRVLGEREREREREHEDRPRTLALALACAAAPLAWMAWNAHAHDGPLHFFRRVSSFKRAIGEGTTDTWTALVLYPRLLFTVRPEISVPALLFLPALRDRETRRRWLLPLLAAAGQIAFLAYGNVRDGAPAHHAERALLSTFVVLAMFAGDVGLSWAKRSRLLRIAAAGGAAAWIASFVLGARPVPGTGPNEVRTAQVDRGLALRGEEHLVVTPCAFEHFALLAAYAAPERATLEPRTNAPVTEQCPAALAR